MVLPCARKQQQKQQQQHPKLHCYLDRQKTIPCQRLYLSQTHSNFGRDRETCIQASQSAQWLPMGLRPHMLKRGFPAMSPISPPDPLVHWIRVACQKPFLRLGTEVKCWDRLMACNKTTDSEAERFPPVCVGASYQFYSITWQDICTITTIW